MTLPALRDDALRTESDGFSLRLSLPWIRSMPIASLTLLSVTIDDVAVDALRIDLGDRTIAADSLALESGWWFIQDRLVIRGDRALTDGQHGVRVSFNLTVPYLMAGPTALSLPFELERALTLDAVARTRSVTRDVA